MKRTHWGGTHIFCRPPLAPQACTPDGESAAPVAFQGQRRRVARQGDLRLQGTVMIARLQGSPYTGEGTNSSGRNVK